MRVGLLILITSVTLIALGALLYWRGSSESRTPAAVMVLQPDSVVRWSGRLHAGQTVWIHDLNGGIESTPAAGDDVEIVASKHGPGNIAAVQVIAVPSEDGVTMCALYQANTDGCRGGADFNPRMFRHHEDVTVDFTVRLPKGIDISAMTTNGDVKVSGATADVKAVTVNGGVDAQTSDGDIEAVTVNGEVHVAAGSLSPGRDVKVTTVNGSVTLDLPAETNADVDLHSIAGDIESAFAVPVQGSVSSHKLVGSIGRGGADVKVTTVNGTIRLQKLAPAPQRSRAATSRAKPAS